MPAAVIAAPADVGQNARTQEAARTARWGIGTMRKRMSLAAMASDDTARRRPRETWAGAGEAGGEVCGNPVGLAGERRVVAAA